MSSHRYVNAILHPAHGLLYLHADAESNFPYWVRNLAHARFFDKPVKKYGASVIHVALGEKRLREIGAPLDLNPIEAAPWAIKGGWTNNDSQTRAAHKRHVEEIKANSWRRPIQKKDLTLYISMESLTTPKMQATTNPLIAQKLWGEKIIEGTLIRSLGFEQGVE